jgi:hypothetical protein
MHSSPNRKSLRLQNYNYAQPGGYFVTIVSKDRAPIFGDINENLVILSSIGETLGACWQEIPLHFPNTSIDEFVIMPNHLHGVIFINESSVGATHASPLRGDPMQSRGPVSGSMAAIIGSFKSSVSRRVHALPCMEGRMSGNAAITNISSATKTISSPFADTSAITLFNGISIMRIPTTTKILIFPLSRTDVE